MDIVAAAAVSHTDSDILPVADIAVAEVVKPHHTGVDLAAATDNSPEAAVEVKFRFLASPGVVGTTVDMPIVLEGEEGTNPGVLAAGE